MTSCNWPGENRKGGWYGRPGWPPGFRPVGFFTTGFFEPGGFAEGGMEELLEFLPSFSSRSLIRFSAFSNWEVKTLIRLSVRST